MQKCKVVTVEHISAQEYLKRYDAAKIEVTEHYMRDCIEKMQTLFDRSDHSDNDNKLKSTLLNFFISMYMKIIELKGRDIKIFIVPANCCTILDNFIYKSQNYVDEPRDKSKIVILTPVIIKILVSKNIVLFFAERKESISDFIQACALQNPEEAWRVAYLP